MSKYNSDDSDRHICSFLSVSNTDTLLYRLYTQDVGAFCHWTTFSSHPYKFSFAAVTFHFNLIGGNVWVGRRDPAKGPLCICPLRNGVALLYGCDGNDKYTNKWRGGKKFCLLIFQFGLRIECQWVIKVEFLSSHRLFVYNNNNNNNILYSSQREIKAFVRSHNEEHISIILSWKNTRT